MALVQGIEDTVTGEGLGEPEDGARRAGPVVLSVDDFEVAQGWSVDPRWLGRPVIVRIGPTEGAPGATMLRVPGEGRFYYLEDLVEDDLLVSAGSSDGG